MLDPDLTNALDSLKRAWVVSLSICVAALFLAKAYDVVQHGGPQLTDEQLEYMVHAVS